MAESWVTYRRSIGDRSPLFAAVVAAWPCDSALYPGSYLDLSPSAAIRSVAYVDTDRRAARFFGDRARVDAELADAGVDAAEREVRFLHVDYTDALPIDEASVDLLISLFAGPVSDHCRRYVRPGGMLLANTSHGDASLAALDADWELVATVHHRDGRYRLDTDDLDRYLVPKKPADADPALIRERGRGVAYTRSAFAYVFRADRF